MLFHYFVIDYNDPFPITLPCLFIFIFHNKSIKHAKEATKQKNTRSRPTISNDKHAIRITANKHAIKQFMFFISSCCRFFMFFLYVFFLFCFCFCFVFLFEFLMEITFFRTGTCVLLYGGGGGDVAASGRSVRPRLLRFFFPLRLLLLYTVLTVISEKSSVQFSNQSIVVFIFVRKIIKRTTTPPFSGLFD